MSFFQLESSDTDNLGQPGRVNVNVGVDVGLAYLVSDVETFLPLTATLRAGVTAF